MPCLAVAGALDQKFSLEATSIAAGIVNAHSKFVAGARHAAHLEQPTATAELVQSFIRQS
jgi:pimeloyl-ACP methyl ester carboxylesterase